MSKTIDPIKLTKGIKADLRAMCRLLEIPISEIEVSLTPHVTVDFVVTGSGTAHLECQLATPREIRTFLMTQLAFSVGVNRHPAVSHLLFAQEAHQLFPDTDPIIGMMARSFIADLQAFIRSNINPNVDIAQQISVLPLTADEFLQPTIDACLALCNQILSATRARMLEPEEVEAADGV